MHPAGRGTKHARGGVPLGESIAAAWRALKANPMRSALTMLGVIIGVSAVIALVSVGEGAGHYVTGQVQGLGSNLVIVTPRNARLRVQDATTILERVPGVVEAMPSLAFTERIKWGIVTYPVAVEGVTEAYPRIRNFQVEDGRFIAPLDETARSRVAVLGRVVAEELFGAVYPIGQELLIRGQPFTVVGVMERKGELLGQDHDNRVYVPLSTLQRLAGTQQVQMIYCQLVDGALAAPVGEHIQGVMGEVHRRRDAVRVHSQEQILEMVETVTATLSFLLASIAGVSLLVGGIGIMNIMLVSVTERTREIGLRKAVGGKTQDILSQFLIEAILLSLGGGMVGVLVGSRGARLLSRLGGWDPVVSLDSIGMAFVFALAVGVFFGMYPAVRASRLDPIEALRRE
ncbi:MAG: ABC transporter permease [Bacillota bacterium]